MVRAAYIDAEALVKRCLDSSHRTWNAMARTVLRSSSMSAASGPYSPGRRSRLNSRASMSDAPLGGAQSPCRVCRVVPAM